MFDTIYSSNVTSKEFLIMAACAVVSGFLYAYVMSFKIHAQKRFFAVVSIMPFIVGAAITFVKGNIGAGVAIGGGVFGITRFRSAQGSADEIAAILIASAAGIAFGMGYVAYGILILITLAAVFILLSVLHVFDHKSLAADKLLRITIPESLEYHDVFDDTFKHYLKKYESVGVKTTGMGSMYRLSFKIQMKNPKEEKEMIDELRTKNGNLEIAILPYSDAQVQL